MKGIVRIALAGAGTAGALAVGGVASAGPNPNPVINFDDSSFTPRTSSATVSAGSTEGIWIADPNPPPLAHNIREDRKLFRSGPVDEIPEKQLHISAGRYHYYCELHGSRAGGMDGVIKVRPTVSAGVGDTAVITWSDADAEAKHRYAVQFREQGKRWQDWKRRAKAIGGVFGANGKPIDADPAKTYQVRVKTFVPPKSRKRKPMRTSRFSPPLGFQVGP